MPDDDDRPGAVSMRDALDRVLATADRPRHLLGPTEER